MKCSESEYLSGEMTHAIFLAVTGKINLMLDYFLWGYVKSLVYADKPQTLDHLEDNIRRVIADIRPQMLGKVIENWTSRLDYIRARRGSPMPEIIFKMKAYIRSKRPRVAQVVRKFSPAQPSKASRRHLNKQGDEKVWQGGNINPEEKSFHHSGTL
ncbi:hypothetical protein TNCV_4873811 [Trichonephila clavipes]|nr:hypothetical protein TNCV_4873811 [Trichonephila clavipes]